MRRYWPAGLLLAWVCTRLLVVWLLLGRHAWVQGDLDYYVRSLAAAGGRGLAGTLVEYPLPGVVVVAVPWLLVTALGGPGSEVRDGYVDAVLALSLLADAAFTVLVALTARPRRGAALAVWLLAVPLLGATTYARFDLVPGVLAGAALLLLARRPRFAAGLAAVGAGLKLWPALVLPALAARRPTRTAVLAVAGVVGAALAGASVVVGGWDRLFSPLTWQAGRGLQIESVAATPAMVGWAVSPGTFEVRFTAYNAYEVSGPGTGALVAVSEALTLVALAVLAVLWAAAFRVGRRLTLDSVAWLVVAAVSAFVVTSKVLSPQYLLWLLPLAAAAAGIVRGRGMLAWAGVLLVATAATQLVFPELYGRLVRGGELTGMAVLVLALRNLLLAGLAGWALAAAARGVSEAARSRASRRGRPEGTCAAAGAAPPTRT